MKNLLRTLICGEQVSLTLIDSTEIVNQAIHLHSLSICSALTLGKALTLTTFLASCLKEEKGAVSLSVRGDGEGGNISVSGNYALSIRGYIANPSVSDCKRESSTDSSSDFLFDLQAERRCLGDNGTLTVIREDGYGLPFVGSCRLDSERGLDGAFENYYSTSEQLPTYFSSVIRLSPDGKCLFAGAAVLQPLPFADKNTLDGLPKGEALYKIAGDIEREGIENCAKIHFSANSEGFALREAAYKCNCSRKYLSGVILSLGKEQIDDILKDEGEIKVHCDYCNKDYVFTKDDVEKNFS